MANKGILGRKLGMTQVWDDENRVVPVTVIQAGPCRVVQLKTPERDGYAAVQVTFGETKAAASSPSPSSATSRRPASSRRKHLVELRVDDLVGLRGRPGAQGRRVRRRRARRRHRRSARARASPV